MNRLKRTLAALMAVTAMALAVSSCGGSSDSANESSEALATKASEENTLPSADKDEITGGNVDLAGTSITWLSYYDINPQGMADRSNALALYEDVYGCSVNYVQTTSEDKFNKLASMIISGEEVDMFPYEWEAVPNGVLKNQYDPLDPYYDILGMDDEELWGDMEDVIDMFSYNGGHYVIPYCISDPLIITYSRTMMQAEGLDDPYELYQDGEWDWDSFMSMMQTFVANAPAGQTRYGINGWFGQALIQSTGHTIINYDGSKFSNNIGDPEIEKAELLMQDIASSQLYDPSWMGNFPENQSTLFYAMADWALGASNAKNPDLDLMIVPFPKEPGADEYYLCCNYGARMLVKNSKKGEAVAAYIRCERIAATEEKYQDIAKSKALIPQQTASGIVTSFITEEQYDALVTYKDPAVIVPMFDFGYGMGDRMYGDGEYTYETRGVMNNLTEALLNGESAVDSWATLREAWTGVIDEEIAAYN